MPYKNYKDDVIWRWKNYGIITDDWDVLYKRYVETSNCEICNISLVSGNLGGNKKAIDHNHTTGAVRYICCHSCNMNTEKMTHKNNKLGERNIYFVKKKNRYIARKQSKGKVVYRKIFKTLDEAISFRDSFVFFQAKIPDT